MTQQDSLQALTVGISTKGITSFFNYATQLISGSITAPNQSNLAAGQTIPIGYCDNVTLTGINLTGGSVQNVRVLSSPVVTQQPNGTINVTLTASFQVNYGEWEESGQEVQGNPGPPPMPPTITNFDNPYYNAFSFEINSITLNFDVTISAGNSIWSVVINNPTQSNIQVGTINLPPDSYLNNGSFFSCINSMVHDQLVNIIASENYAQDLASALNAMLGTIPDSGNLNSSIVYEFNPSSLAYPAGGGICAGIKGQVTCNKNAYNGSPVTIPPASIDATRDLSINVSIYELNALAWAFYTNNDLNVAVTPESLGNPAELNTRYYKELIPGLYAFAPDCEMDISIQASEAPVVVVSGNALQLTTGFDVTVNVVINENPTFAFSFGVNRLDSFSGFTLGANSNTVNVLNFQFSEISSNATLIKAAKADIVNQMGIEFLWGILDGLADIAIANIGKAGVPIPSVDGYYLADLSPTITVNADNGGYISFSTDICHNG